MYKSSVYLNEGKPLQDILHTYSDYQSYFFDLPGGYISADIEVRLSLVNGISNYYVSYDERLIKRGGHDNGYTVDLKQASLIPEGIAPPLFI